MWILTVSVVGTSNHVRLKLLIENGRTRIGSFIDHHFDNQPDLMTEHPFNLLFYIAKEIIFQLSNNRNRNRNKKWNRMYRKIRKTNWSLQKSLLLNHIMHLDHSMKSIINQYLQRNALSIGLYLKSLSVIFLFCQ